MKNPVFALLCIVSMCTIAFAQTSLFDELNIIRSGDASTSEKTEDHQLRGVAAAGGNVITYTADKLYISSDEGATWRQPVFLPPGQAISGAAAASNGNAAVLVFDGERGTFEYLEISSAGLIGVRRPVSIAVDDLSQTHLDDVTLGVSGNIITATFRLQTSSNFVGTMVYRSNDGGISWQRVSRSVEIRTSDEPAEKRAGSWQLVSEGHCSGYKTGCVQETRLLNGGADRTPSQIRALTAAARAAAASAAGPQFSQAPGGSTRISLNTGFDKCTAGSIAQMQTWWNSSPHHVANMYMSGRNRGCAQPTLNANWVKQVTAMGWGLIPTIIGYQSPCTSSATSQKFSMDPATAEMQGRGEADIAVADAINLGLAVGSILYYDMERYDETTATVGCRAASTAFIKGWTERTNELGFVSGAYGSPKNAQEDWLTLPVASRPHAIWMARWDNVPNVWTYVSFASFPTTEWANHQRIKQWQAPHDENWGGVTFNIDGNILDAPVVGHAIAKNKNADFDGDGKADISVFRAASGTWFYLGSGTAGFRAVAFGQDGDIPVPGDYDGDGKTDAAVFRPATNTWYFQTKNAFNVRVFGEAGDIPAAADYDGDGRTDIAVFRPSSGTWYIRYSDSRSTFASYQFGASGDKPVVGDYDGDGKADLALFRPSTQTWYYLGSGPGGFSAEQFGEPGDIPVQGDYDGDGRTERAVFRPSNGTWYSYRSTEGFQIREFGMNGDIPAPADFDGDDKTDIAVFRPSAASWFIQGTSGGFSVRSFGESGDLPIPTTYLPR